MAQYFHNFSGDANGSQPSNTSFPYYTPATAVIDTTTFAFPVYKETHSPDNEHPLIFNEIPTDATLEVVAKVRMDTVTPASGTDYQADILLRGSGGPTSRNAYTVNFLRGQFINTEGYLANSSFTFGAGSSYTFAANTWYWIRTKVVGNVVSYRVWLDGASEPTGWDTSTDASNRIPGAGWAGIGSWRGLGTRYWAQVGIGTAGSAAPTSAVDVSLTVNNLAVATQEANVLLDAYVPVSQGTGGYIYGPWGGQLIGITDYGAGIAFYGNPLVVSDLAVASQIDNLVMVQDYAMAINALAVATQEDNVATVYNSLLSLNALAVGTQEDNVALVQQHLLTLNNLAVATQEDNVTLITEAAALANALLVATQTDNVTLVQQHLLAINSLLVATQEGNAAITENRTLAMQDLMSATQIDAVTTVQNYLASVQNLQVGTLADNAAIVQANLLAVQNLQVATNMTNLVIFSPLIVQDLVVTVTLQDVVNAIKQYIPTNGVSTGEFVDSDISVGIIKQVPITQGEFGEVTIDNGFYKPTHIQTIDKF